MSQENFHISCPCCTATVFVKVTGYAQTTVDDRYRKYYPSNVYSVESPTSPRSPSKSPNTPWQHIPVWISPDRDEELRRRDRAVYCICETGAHESEREEAFPCIRCHASVCAHIKCRHSHEINDCDDEPRRRVRFPTNDARGRLFSERYHFSRNRYEK